MTELSPAQRRTLRAQAHHLQPVVSIASNGLSDAVMKEIHRSLVAHGLIKIRVYGADRAAREAYLRDICAALDAAPVQHIGNLLVVYKAPDEPPVAAARPAPAPARPKRVVTSRAAPAKKAAAGARRPPAPSRQGLRKTVQSRRSAPKR